MTTARGAVARRVMRAGRIVGVTVAMAGALVAVPATAGATARPAATHSVADFTPTIPVVWTFVSPSTSATRGPSLTSGHNYQGYCDVTDHGGSWRKMTSGYWVVNSQVRRVTECEKSG